jgi:hypothetical protein
MELRSGAVARIAHWCSRFEFLGIQALKLDVAALPVVEMQRTRGAKYRLDVRALT